MQLSHVHEPLLTTQEAAHYLRFRSSSGIRTAVARGELRPLGSGPKGCHLFTRRYTFTDLVRRANVDVVVRRALTGHVTEEMQRKYSTVGLDEKRAAVAGVIRLVPPERTRSTAAAAIEGEPKGEPNPVPLRLVPPETAVATAKGEPEGEPSHRNDKRPVEAML